MGASKAGAASTEKTKTSEEAQSIEDAKPKKTLHVRLDGKSRDFAVIDLKLTPKSTDDEIVAALAKHLRIEVERFSLFHVERTKDGMIFVRPDAVFEK